MSAEDRDGWPRYRVEDLAAFMARVLVHFGLPEADAEAGARCLADADLSGIDTHGIANFVSHWHYAPGLRLGAVNPRAEPTIVAETPATATMDSDRGFGPVVAGRAMDLAVAKAAQVGVGSVAVRDGCHFGAAGYFARQAAERGMVGMVMCPTLPSAVAPGGADCVFGTNPVAFAAPVAGRHPFVLDMATTTAAGTKLQHARRRGEAIPLGWAVDAEGRPTTDAVAAADGGLLPLGSSDGAGYKGFGLALVVDILGGLLSGTGTSTFGTYSPEWRQGYFMCAWDIAAFGDPADFARGMTTMVTTIESSRPAPGTDRVTIPGDRQAETRRRRGADGIPLDPAVADAGRALAEECRTTFPTPR